MDIEDVQNNYFLGDLINKSKGKYYFKKYGMNAASGTLVLFQFDNRIIASATLLEIEKLSTPKDGQYYGVYIFDVNSVKVFQPIVADEINSLDSNVSLFAEEISYYLHRPLVEGAKKQVVVNAYERNSRAREMCIQYYGCTCSVCNFNFVKFYGEEFAGEIHVHHLKALSEVDEEYEVHPINDLRPVCPNCHLALHSNIGFKPYSIEELKEKIQSQRG